MLTPHFCYGKHQSFLFHEHIDQTILGGHLGTDLSVIQVDTPKSVSSYRVMLLEGKCWR